MWAVADGERWSDVVDYSYFLYGSESEDFSRASPPFGRHVWILPALTNLSSQSISAVEFKIRLLDAFGDVIYTSEPAKLHFGLMPGEDGFATQTLYFEDNPFVDDVYDRLVGPAQSEALRSELWILRVAFEDQTVESYPEEWVADKFSRLESASRADATEREFNAPIHSYPKSEPPFESDPIDIRARRWLVAWLSFAGQGAITLEVFNEETLVAEATFDVADMDGALIVEDGPGTYRVRVTGAGFDALVVQEARE